MPGNHTSMAAPTRQHGFGQPRRTPRQLWRRGREIVRDEGWRRLVFTALRDLGYRPVLVLERRLDEPIVPVAAHVPLGFETLEPAALHEYLQLQPAIPRPQLENRFTRGDACYAARVDGRLAAATWVTRDPHFFRAIGCRYVIPPSEVYVFDSFTAPELRGRRVMPALGVWVLERLREAGVTRAELVIAPDNMASRRARARNGFRPFMRIDYVRLGRRRWHWHRPTGADGRVRSARSPAFHSAGTRAW
jgi:GNAT superfamily N-acetyltransferase